MHLVEASPVMEQLRRRPWARLALLIGPAALWLAVFVIAPLGMTMITSFWRIVNYRLSVDWNTDNYADFFNNSLYYDTLLRTLAVAAIAGVIAAVMSIPLAWVIVFKIRRGRVAVLGLVVMAMWIGYLLRIYGWRLVFGAEGVVNTALGKLGLVDQPVGFLLFSDFALVVALVHLSLPFAFIPIYLALERLPPDYLDAASDLGANRRRSFLLVALPIVGNAIWAGATFAFVISFGDYFSAILVGAPDSALIGNLAASQFGTTVNWAFGAAIGVLLVIVVFAALALPPLMLRALHASASLVPRAVAGAPSDANTRGKRDKSAP